jgi:penicillin-binding protein 1A
MKYVVISISIFFALFCIVVGIIFYSTYALWLNDRDEILQRLHKLETMLDQSRTTVSLQPDLREGMNTTVYDRSGRLIGVFARGERTLLPFQETPPLLASTVLLMEDRRFYSHNGFDLRGITSAMLDNIRNMALVRGGSTISQQLAKVLFTDSRRTIRRKIYELFCTLEIEERFTKNEILSLYLNSIYFGHHAFGIENASMFYFNKSVMDLNLYETALLVGLIPGPNRFSPLVSTERSMRRQKIVLNSLYQSGMLEAGDLDEPFERFWENYEKVSHRPTVSFWSMERNESPYFVEYVRQILVEQIGEQAVQGGGLKVHTTLDLEKQRVAEQVLTDGLALQNRKTELEQRVEGALVAIQPATGHILAMVGGSGFSFENQFNRAVASSRQVGSAFKPFVAAAAIEELGYNARTVIVDQPLSIRTVSGLWEPRNYGGHYYGPVSLETALQKSLNSVAVQLVQQVGPEEVSRLIREALGLDEDEEKGRFQPFLSSALGVYSFSPLELVQAYGIFATSGYKCFPHAITRVENHLGEIVLDMERDIAKKKVALDLEEKLQVIDRTTAGEISSMLTGVLKRGGTGYRAVQGSGFPIEASGKTGTTNDFTDAWFVGYTENVAAAVWVGFDDPAFSLGEGQAGGVVAAPIWVEFIGRALWREG